MLALIAVVFLMLTPALAVEPDEMLADPKLEARAQHLSKELRCVVCQNETIEASNAPLAKDMRLALRERLAAGDTDAQAKAFLVERYGNFVLMRPPVQGNTLLLWGGPFLVLAIGGVALALRARRKADAAAPLSEDEQRALAARLNE